MANSFQFVSDVVAVVIRHVHASWSISLSDCNLPSSLVNGGSRVGCVLHGMLLSTFTDSWFGRALSVQICVK